MFLFLSKLLPLLVYPLGLSMLLLVFAWFAWKRRRRLARGAIAIAFFILWISSTPLLKDALMGSLENRYIPQGELPRAEAIVVLGGATRSQNPPRPWVDVNESGDRMIHAAQLYRAGKAPKVILSGGRINWRGDGQPESADMAELMVFMGVPKDAILQDPESLNTRQNAVNVQQIVEREQIEGPLLLVTSGFHMPRSMAIFRKLGMEAIPAPTDFLVAEGDTLKSTAQARLLSLLPEVENLWLTTKAIKEYIGFVIYWMKGWV